MEQIVLREKRKIIFWGGRIMAATYRDMLPSNMELIAVFDNDNELEPIFPDVPLYYGKQGFYQWKKDNMEASDEKVFFVVTIGSRKGKTRVEVSQFLESEGLIPYSIIHPSAQIAPSATLGKGVVVFPLAVVDAATIIGDYTIVAYYSAVAHGTKVGKGVMFCGSNAMGGGCLIGDYATFYVGSHVAANLKIGKNAVIGIGSVVISDVADDTTVFGCPAMPVRSA